jgi:hypothetical protein
MLGKRRNCAEINHNKAMIADKKIAKAVEK